MTPNWVSFLERSGKETYGPTSSVVVASKRKRLRPSFIAQLSLLAGLCLFLGRLIWVMLVFGSQRIQWATWIYPLSITALFAVLLLSNGRWRRLNAIVRIVLGLAFVLSLLDRFGLMGAYGRPWVSFGDYTHFIAFTQKVTSFLPASWSPALAALATLCETVIGAALVFGVKTHCAVLAALALVLIYGTAILISFGFGPQFPYFNVLLASGAWFLSTLDCSAWSVGAFRRRKNNSNR